MDAGSQDRTVALAREHRGHVPIRVLPAGRVFPGVARNLGVSAASGHWIAFTDGGITLDPGWLQELMSAAGEGADVVFGGMDPDCDSFFRQCAALAYVSPRDEHGIRGPFIASSLVVRAKFLSVGGFPNFRAAEDLVLVERLQAAAAKVSYAPRAQVRWQIPGTFSATFERFANYSYHNLIAARGRHWHLGVARLYLLLGLVTIALCSIGAMPLAGLAIPAFFAARAARAAWVKRHSFPFSTLHPTRVLWAAVIIVIIDVATAVGAARWLRTRVRP